MWRVTEVQALSGRRIAFRFADGAAGTLDLSGDLWGPLGEPLRDPAVFAQVGLDEFGAVCWPNGFDVAPEVLRQAAGALQGAGKAETR